MIGLPRGVVQLVPYTTEWIRLFEAEKARLQAAIGEHVLDIQHVGSTAIPGMIAKPIIDIGIAVEAFEEARVCVQPVESLGYEYRGEQGIPRRHYFVKGDPRIHHIHMNEVAVETGRTKCCFETTWLGIRSWLRNMPRSSRTWQSVIRWTVRRT